MKKANARQRTIAEGKQLSDVDSKRIQELERELAETKRQLEGARFYEQLREERAKSAALLKLNEKSKVANAYELEREKLKSAALVKALEFECGNRCAHQNPCNAREALAKWGKW